MIEEKVLQDVIEVSNDLNDISYYVTQLDAVLGAVEELMEDIDDATYKGWHKERTAELLVINISRKVRLIDMALRPLSDKMGEKVGIANDTAEEMIKYLQSDSVPKDARISD